MTAADLATRTPMKDEPAGPGPPWPRHGGAEPEALDWHVAAGDDAPTILLVDGDLGRMAALTLVLRHRLVVDGASTVTSALLSLARRAPVMILVFDDPMVRRELHCLLEAIRARSSDCRVLIVRKDGSTLGAAVESAQSDRVLVIPAGPLEELLVRIGAFLAPVLGPDALTRVLWCSGYVFRLQEYIGRSYRHPVTVGSAARAIGVSAGHLAHVFRAQFGMTVKRYAAAVRVEVAKCLLRDTEAKLEVVAELAGFSDAPHLSRVFKDHTGQRPGRYRHLAVGRSQGP